MRSLHFRQWAEGPPCDGDGDESGCDEPKTKHERKQSTELLSEALVGRAILSDLKKVRLPSHCLVYRGE